MSVSMGVMFGQMLFVLVALALLLVFTIAAIRFLFAATRWMNRKADQLEQDRDGTTRAKPEAR